MTTQNNLSPETAALVARALEIARAHRLVADRKAALEAAGFSTAVCSMGSGGVGKVKNMSNGETRVQVGYTEGRWGYALCAIIPAY